MSAVEPLSAARAASIAVAVDGTDLILEATTRPRTITELLGQLRTHKAEIVELLCGNRCRHCGTVITREDWQHPGGARALVFSDNSAAHCRCHEDAEADRILRAARRAIAPKLADDEAEVTLRGELE